MRLPFSPVPHYFTFSLSLFQKLKDIALKREKEMLNCRCNPDPLSGEADTVTFSEGRPVIAGSLNAGEVRNAIAKEEGGMGTTS